MTEIKAIYLGEADADFYAAKAALSEFVHSVEVVKSMALAKSLLETQNITLIVLNLGLDADETYNIIEAIREERPRMKFIAVGRLSFPQVIAYNYYCIARGMDGTITIEQFKKAVREMERRNSIHLAYKIGLGFICIGGIISFALLSGSAVGKFLGALWTTLLVIEFAYYLIFVQQRMWRR